MLIFYSTTLVTKLNIDEFDKNSYVNNYDDNNNINNNINIGGIIHKIRNMKSLSKNEFYLLRIFDIHHLLEIVYNLNDMCKYIIDIYINY